MAIIGAILGDIAGSQLEFNRCLDPDNCELFTEACDYTDDTVMSLAVKYAVDNKIPFGEAMREIGQPYQFCGYGGQFCKWMYSPNPRPYGSYGNGSAMRVSYVSDYYGRLEDVQKAAKKTALPTHNHPEGIKGAAVAERADWSKKPCKKSRLRGIGKVKIHHFYITF